MIALCAFQAGRMRRQKLSNVFFSCGLAPDASVGALFVNEWSLNASRYLHKTCAGQSGSVSEHVGHGQIIDLNVRSLELSIGTCYLISDLQAWMFLYEMRPS